MGPRIGPQVRPASGTGILVTGAPPPPRSDPRRQLTPNATLSERHDITADIARFIVRPDATVPTFKPGQYFSLGLEVNGGPVLRPYSTASRAGTTGALEFLVRRVACGTFTPSMWDLVPGDRLWIGPARGLFVLKPDDPRTHLLVSAGTGLAPFISMLHELSGGKPAVTDALRPRVVVVHGASYATELAYRPWLEDLAASNRGVTYVPTVSRPAAEANAGWSGRAGRVEQVLASIVAEFGLQPAATVAYLCGNPDMVERSREVLLAAGLPADAIVHENYWVADGTHAA